MGKKAKSKRESNSVPETRYAMRSGPNIPLLVLSGIGILLTSYLAYTSFAGGSVKGCAAGGGCDVVLSSRWATLFGLPTAFWGLMAYAGIAAIAFFVRRVDKHWSYAFSAAFFGVSYSVYLTSVSLLILKAACPYCLTSLTLMSSILGLVISQRPAEVKSPWRRLVLGRAIIAGLAIMLLHLDYTTPLESADQGPEDPIARGLAEHLTQKGVKFYGASWCPHCQEQKRLFGAAAKRLPYIECSPNGRNAPSAGICQAVGIQTYPTWVIDGHWVSEVMTLQQLADASGYALIKSAQPTTPATP